MTGRELERRFRELKMAIITKLRGSGVGFEAIRVASNENNGGGLALILHVDDSWSMKVDMGGYKFNNSDNIDLILREYALVKDAIFQELIIQAPAEYSSKRYIDENRQMLLGGLVQSMELVLQKLNED